MFEQIRQQYSCNAQNDTSYIAYQNGDYEKAFPGKQALEEARQKRNKNRRNFATGFVIGLGAIGAANYGRKKYLMQRQR